MPLHDYFCGVCGQILVDQYRSCAEGARARPPVHCGRSMSWIPQTTAMDVGGVKTAGFRGFHTTDGRGQPVFIDSLHKLRQVEKEAEQAYRNGEGQPMVWRRWAQDNSNADAPTLSRSYDGGEHPTKEAVAKFGPQIERHSEEPDRAYGPGVQEANATALKGG